jgi:hypothetical protein
LDESTVVVRVVGISFGKKLLHIGKAI